jgi:hypothetical protein
MTTFMKLRTTTHKRLASFVGTTALATTLLAPSSALANPANPGAIKSKLDIPSPPPCALCHQGAPTTGTVRTPFGIAFLAAGGKSDPSSVPAALDKLAQDKTDSDGDCFTDVDELKRGTDPNKPETVNACDGGVAKPPPQTGAPPTQDATYGCMARVSPEAGNATESLVFTALCTFFALVGLRASKKRRATGSNATRS